MENWILQHEASLRLGAFGGILLTCALAEMIRPRRLQSLSRLVRWPANLGIVVVNTLLLRLLFPAAAVGIAAHAQQQGWGLLAQIDLPLWLSLPLALLALDVAIYAQHVLAHRIPLLWRLHRVHHVDLDFDVTTALRFHPLEILLSMLYKALLIYLIGPPLVAVVLFEVLLSSCALFNHSNWQLPESVDRVLRRWLVTPDMHRVHHSTLSSEHNRNFGFCLSCWDHLFGTYTAQPAAGHTAMRIGLDHPRDPAHCARLPGMLALPFRRG